MNNFNIQDAQQLLTQAGNLAQVNQNIMRVQEQLSQCCEQIGNAWQSDTEDKTSYLGNLQKNLSKLQTLTSAIYSLSNKLTDFAQQSIKTANNG
jgi:transposase-like protein